MFVPRTDCNLSRIIENYNFHYEALNKFLFSKKKSNKNRSNECHVEISPDDTLRLTFHQLHDSIDLSSVFHR